MSLLRNTYTELMIHQTATSIYTSPQALMDNCLHWLPQDKRNYWKSLGYKADYHFLINYKGNIFEGQPINFKAFHSGWDSYNETAIAICLIGKIHEAPPTPEQYQALVKLSKKIIKKYNLKKVLRHSDVTATNCPGDKLDWRKYLDDIKAKTYRFRLQGNNQIVEIYQDGKLIKTEPITFHPVSLKGNVVIPVSALRLMGATVNWNANTKEVDVII